MKQKMALFSFVAAICFATLSLFLPPEGEIDSSVLLLVAQLLVLCTTLLGIKAERTDSLTKKPNS
ncbi:MAG: hypothetical protein K6E86_04530 [Bacteroidales bacterium]|nr:hypothetical protein [Bacteroidales bacterium]